MKNIDYREPVYQAVKAFFTTQIDLAPGSTVLCACSGGADSVCLLHSLLAVGETLGFRVAAAHYNHNLRGEESRRDAEFVEELAQKFGVELILGAGDVAARARERSCGIEETAREMRYSFLMQAAGEIGAQLIATAHNANDNAETLLMRLIRGTGTRGLSGIPPVREKIVRPLLTVSRQEIEDYLSRHSLPFVQDSSNFEDTYTRNRIRHQLLPVLEEISPGIVERLNRTAAHLRADEEFLSGEARKIILQAERAGDTLRIPAVQLAQSSPAVAIRAARMLLGELRAGNDNCTSAHLQALLELCQGEKASGELQLPGGIFVRREYEMIVLTTKQPDFIVGRHLLNMPGETKIGRCRLTCREYWYNGEQHQPYHFFLSGRHREIFVRARRTGDMLCRPGRKSKSLKKLFIDEKIPLRCRDALPVLEISGRIAAVAGLGPDIVFLPGMGELSWEIIITNLEENSRNRRKEGIDYAGEGHSGSIV